MEIYCTRTGDRCDFTVLFIYCSTWSTSGNVIKMEFYYTLVTDTISLFFHRNVLPVM